MKEQIDKAIKTAMIEKQKNKLTVLRAIKTEFTKFEKTGKDLTNDQCLAILRKLVKQGKDSAKQFFDAGRDELGDKENYEVEILESFLPTEMNDTDLENMVGELVEKLEATSMKDMGKVMGYIKAAQVNASPARISKYVKAALSQ